MFFSLRGSQAHGLGTDVSLKDPDRLVSSFASQLSFEHDSNAKVNWLNCHERKEGNELDFLGSIFRQLGKEMIKLGLLVARVCDIGIQGAGLENAILQASTAKGRLIHYHSLVEKQMLRRIEAGKQRRILESNKSSPSSHSNKDLWQQWHYDYGIFTILTMPMFLRSNHTNVDSMDDAHKLNYSSSLETSESNSLFPHIGLKILNIGNRMVEFVCAPNDCLLVQVGEAAQILTGGKLRATAHCVCQPLERDDVSRETFVVFLQPSWDMCLVSPNEYETNGKRLESAVLEKEFSMIQCRVPPLESRWRNGCTFAEFSRETTKQYYGTNGAQAKK